MKRTLKFSAAALLAVVILWACGSANGPKEVGEKFLNAMASGDIEGAKKLATKESQNALDMMKGSSEARQDNPDKIEIGDLKEEGDKATLAYKENGKDKELALAKVGGEWKATWKKSGGTGEPIEVPGDSAKPAIVPNDSIVQAPAASE